MSIQFNPNALSAFSNVNFGRDDALTVEDRDVPKSNSNKPNGEVVDINAY